MTNDFNLSDDPKRFQSKLNKNKKQKGGLGQKSGDELENLIKNIRISGAEKSVEREAKTLGLKYTDLTGFVPNAKTLALVPRDLAHEGRFISFKKTPDKLLLGVVDPGHAKTVKALQTLKDNTKLNIEIFLISENSYQYLMSFYDNLVTDAAAYREVDLSETILDTGLWDAKKLREITKEQDKISTSELVEAILAGAISAKASDIHIEPQKEDLRVRFRIDGFLQDVLALPSEKAQALISRIKVLSELKINIHDISQDGTFLIKTKDSNFDIRVSVLPATYGESVVMRLLQQGASFLNLEELGMREEDRKIIEAVAEEPNGLILNTGPTGSGKTTTLYALLSELNKPGAKIITLEDPVEYRLEGISQSQVNEGEGFGFANGLRSILRQDPDIIMVGEVRDSDTAKMAVQASLTGHLVLSTLHTNDAVGAIPRMIEMGVKPYLIADASSIIIAQRLVRKLDPKYRQEHALTAEEKGLVEKYAPEAVSKTFYEPGAAPEGETGYRGRIGIFEILKVGESIRSLINSLATTDAIRDKALEEGMTPLIKDGILKAAEGITSLSEVMRVTKEE